ncbi:MAG: sigma-70 family RNA polymerase sigma factor [Phycisphaerales bacterium]|nr:sigma-70 family RNA polymerase sigma factor [Phycisphaerales bacterium]
MPPPSPSDRVETSAQEVFEILVREHADMLTAFLRSLVYDSAAVDDLFQETMLTAWRRLPDYDRERPFGPWLRGIASNMVLQHRRRSRTKLLSCEPAVLEALDRRFGTLELVPADSFRARAERLRTCMERLPQKLREVVELGYARGLLLREIGIALQATEEAVKKRIQRARDMLLRCLSVDASSSGEPEGTP